MDGAHPAGTRHAGASLIETLVALSVAALLLSQLIPAWDTLILDNRRAAALNQLVRSLQFARSQAVTSGYRTVVCPSADGLRCDGAPWSEGWIVWQEMSDSRTPYRGPDDPLLARIEALPEGSLLHANRNRFVFRPMYYRSTNGTATYCDRRGPEAARAVIVSYTGRVRSADEGPGGRPLDC